MSPPTKFSRWSPTLGQLMILEEMYRSGIKTPNAFQIQQITARLSLHGRIEPKNVFYWFQNHKARDRLKLRRRLCRQFPPQQRLYQHLQLHLYDGGFPRCLEPRSSIETRPFLCNANGSFLQGVEKMEMTPGKVEMETRMCCYDWMMTKGIVGPHPQGPTKPPKTLQLFPVTSSNLEPERPST